MAALSQDSGKTSLCVHQFQPREISYDALFSKVLGAWIGKSIGGAIGAPFEVHKMLGHDVTKEDCWPADLVPNDDLDIQLLWLEVLEERGPWFTQRDLGEYWQRQCWYDFAEYSFFLYNQQRGVQAPESGRFNNAFYSESMGCPIRSEIWSIAALGNPALAAEFARMDGELDHIDESIWCEQFWAAAGAAAFFCENVEEALDAGRAVVPAASRVMEISRAVPELWKADPQADRIWRRLVRRYGDRDGSKVGINFALQLLSLHAAPEDFRLLMVECARYGFDVDSTAATVGALIGILRGDKSLPADWTARLGERVCCGIDVRHRNSTFEEITIDTLKVVLEMCATRNTGVKVVGVPEEIEREVAERIRQREAAVSVQLDAEYPAGPGLRTGEATEVHIRVSNGSARTVTGALELSSDAGLVLSPERKTLSLAAGGSVLVPVKVEGNFAGSIADKNLFVATWNGEKSVSRTFGVVGARQYKVYGPYWDVYDTAAHAENPFRRPGYRCHPLQVPGIPLTRVHVHNFARLDRAYLDEATLLARDLPGEDPYVVQCPEDYVTNERLGGFVGEACYYLVREIAGPAGLSCRLSCGSTNPFLVWIDGLEAVRSERCDTWGFQEHTADVTFGDKPVRFVIKVVKVVEEFRLMLTFWRKNKACHGPGVSVFHDEFADVMQQVE